jgi:hypothetical protein
MFGWFKSESRKRRKKVKLDRKHLEGRARRFLTNYLEADQIRKPHFYRAVDEVSRTCQPPESNVGLSTDLQIAEDTSQAAMKMSLDRMASIAKDDTVGNFITDACAFVAVAYHRTAGIYVDDDDMRELGTAAVHLLTKATSFMNSQDAPLDDSRTSYTPQP